MDWDRSLVVINGMGRNNRHGMDNGLHHNRGGVVHGYNIWSGDNHGGFDLGSGVCRHDRVDGHYRGVGFGFRGGGSQCDGDEGNESDLGAENSGGLVKI